MTDIQTVRERISTIKNPKLQIIAKFQLLTACRVSEAVGEYAVKPNDLSFTEYKGHPLALWTLHTAKRGGVERIVALPYSQSGVEGMVQYFKSRKRNVFNYGISSVCHLLAEELGDLEYFIEKYSISLKKQEKSIAIPAHNRRMNTHALRHLRLSELVNVYGFDEIDLATFAGWRMKGMAKRYVTSAWGRYIDKLIKD